MGLFQAQKLPPVDVLGFVNSNPQFFRRPSQFKLVDDPAVDISQLIANLRRAISFVAGMVKHTIKSWVDSLLCCLPVRRVLDNQSLLPP